MLYGNESLGDDFYCQFFKGAFSGGGQGSSSEFHKSEIPEDYRNYYDWAVKFQELFLKNLKNKGAPYKKLELASLKDSAEPIRLMVEQDDVSQNQLQLAYDLLNGPDEFWKAVILDANKLRNRIGQLIAQGKKPIKIKNMDLRVQQKIKSYD